MRTARALVLLVGAAALTAMAWPSASQPTPDDPFLVKPYLQLGDLPKLSTSEPLRVLWQAPIETGAKWAVDVRQRDDGPWRAAIVTGGRLVGPPDAEYRVFTVPLTRLEPGGEFEYRVSKNGQVVFSAKGKARAALDQPYRFAVTGDTGANTDQEKRVV